MRCSRANYDQGRGGGGRGSADVVPHVRESALSSWHTARDRAMNRTIARTLVEEKEEKEEKEDQKRRREQKRARSSKEEDGVRFHLACTHVDVQHVKEKREREREK